MLIFSTKKKKFPISKQSTKKNFTVSFKIYDFDNDGCIAKEELYKLLEASLIENSLGIPKEQLTSLVEATFKEADIDGDGKISFEEYKVLVQKHPSMIGNMTISTQASATAPKKKGSTANAK